ncbi:glycosyltransferase family 2 protein [Qipengyuania qiaonensis]|uniref:Glycosyltransferase n=1 Tax=Qipengyuania qiaonensis TaxID=2867240 RepID=A0ABS7J8L0_9SPHN|nr:glycosyltransferase family 2 protein [Qipengyuania qiaonensis]MBX7483655.1 glycosyltransferase [Qipengyuania qiaonensis]
MSVENHNQPVTVLIAAFNAEDTIERAVRSALASALVDRVVVVNDASTDATTTRANRQDDGSGRLLVIEHSSNQGPAAGRNYALTFARSPVVALLDADDYFLPGRFETLLARDDWDMVADNIMFTSHSDAPAEMPSGSGRIRSVELEEFVLRNISRPGKPRGELGFLKPLIKRDFLLRANLAYDESLRLGEDFILYVRALAAGARFKLCDHCGYVAVERTDSLSARHRTEDLERLAQAAWQVHGTLPAGPAREALGVHNRALEAKARHRRLLDDKAEIGIVRSIARSLLAPRYVIPVAKAIYSDKRIARRPLPALPETRTLFSADEFEACA